MKLIDKLKAAILTLISWDTDHFSRLGGHMDRVERNLEDDVPVRVYVAHVTDQEQATTEKRAFTHYGVKPTIILIRKDGWTLGCNAETLAAALKLWQGDWRGMIMLGQVVHQGDTPEVHVFHLGADVREFNMKG